MSTNESDLGCAPYATLDEVEQVVKDFEMCILPLENFNHRAHLTVAIVYLARHEKEAATNLMRRRIQAYLRAKQIATTKESGYHETLTLFYMRLLHLHLERAEAGLSLLELVNKLIRECGDKDLPLRHYAKEHLMSPGARLQWLEPDLKPLEG
jgi:hypothetical protein